MKTQTLAQSPLVSSRLAYGCMRLAGTFKPADATLERQAAGRRAAIAAYEAGYTLFDHADIYCRGVSESVFGQALKEVRGMRERVLIATKCGIRFAGDPRPDSPYRYDFSPDYIVRSCEQSLQRLGVERVDLYQLHRPDYLMEPAAVAGAFDALRREGKVREFGVSNFSHSQLALLQKFCPMPLVVNQVELHLGRLDCLDDGTLDQCLAEMITPLAWSPLGGGYLATGAKVDRKHPRRNVIRNLQGVMDEVAKRYNITRTVLALAWLLKHPARIVPIVGSVNPEHIRDATKAGGVELDREDWYRLLEAARGSRLA